jgi:hypothetical protein
MTLEEIERDLPDSRLRHLLSQIYNHSTNGVPGIAPYATNVGFNKQEAEDAADLLQSKGYFERISELPGHNCHKLDGFVKMHDKGERAGKLIREAYQAKQSKHIETFSRRWKDAETEGFKLLTWAWKQHKGDLNKPVDLKQYAKEAKRSKYEVEAAHDWLRERRYVSRHYESCASNAHCDGYWDVPLNTFFPHEYRIVLTRNGADKAASIIREDKAKWKKGLALIGAGIKEAPAIFGGTGTIVALLLAFGGYFLKAYQIHFHPAPTTQQAQPTTQKG